LFIWEPDRQYDLVFCAFWLSHVPPDALDAFLDTMRRAIRPGGYLVIVDQDIPTQEHRLVPQDDIHALRRTSDGRTFTIVKVFYELTTLEDKLTHLGFEVMVHRLGDALFFLSGRRSER
jgi:demethylmenaquinone methyltransferase/2-methoxy-6-polyprenyl-1,4-benzoquinol methylase